MEAREGLNRYLIKNIRLLKKINEEVHITSKHFWDQFPKVVESIAQDILGKEWKVDLIEDSPQQVAVYREDWDLGLDDEYLYNRVPGFWVLDDPEEDIDDIYNLLGATSETPMMSIYATPISQFIGDLDKAWDLWGKHVEPKLNDKGWEPYGRNIRKPESAWGVQKPCTLDPEILAGCIGGDWRPAFQNIEKGLEEYGEVANGISQVIAEIKKSGKAKS